MSYTSCQSLLCLWSSGAAAVTDGNCQVVPEKTHRDTGACSAGSEPGHSGEEKKAFAVHFIHF